jgi:hypothetical protein
MPTVNATDSCIVQAADMAGYVAQVRPADSLVLGLAEATALSHPALPDLFGEGMVTDWMLQPDPGSYRILEKKTW